MIRQSASVTLRLRIALFLSILGLAAVDPATAQAINSPPILIDTGTGYGTVAAGTAIGDVVVGYTKPSATSSTTQAFEFGLAGFKLLSALPNYATSAAYGVNGAEVVGVSCAANGVDCRAVLWNDNQAPLDLGYVGKGGGAFAIDYAGNAAGSAVSPLDGNQHATVWKGIVASALPRLPGETSSVAVAVIPNEFTGLGDQAVGTTTIGSGSAAETRATFWPGSTAPLDLGIPNSTATSVIALGNTAGPVIGGYFKVPGKSSEHGFIYNRGVITELGTLGGPNSRVNALYAGGNLILGTADDATGIKTAVYWDAQGNITDINTLLAPGTPHLSEFLGMNSGGQIVAVSDDSAGRPTRTFLLNYFADRPALASPRFSPAPGLYPASAPLAVTLSSPSAGFYYSGDLSPAVIKYTLDGSAPGVFSPLIYQAPIELTSSTLIRAVTTALEFDITRPDTRGLYTLVPTFTGDVVTLDGTTAAVRALGSASSGGGIDGVGYAFAADLLGSAVTWDNTVFSLSTAKQPAVANATLTLPATHASAIKLLATSVRGSRPNQTFLVNYTDGTSARFLVSLSDWVKPQNCAGESIVRPMEYRVSPLGTASYGPVYLYGYSLPTDPAKTLQSLSLPPTPYVVVIGAVATAQTAGAPRNVDLSIAGNVHAIGTPGSPITGGGLDGANAAYSSASLPRSVNWAGTSFTLGAAGVVDAVSSGTVALPAVKAGVLDLLATAVNGRQAAQAFTVNYTDGSHVVMPLTLSDWRTPSGATQEFIAATFASGLNAAGAPLPGPAYLYGYTIPLDSTKTLASLVLPNNRNVVLLAANVALSNAILPVQELPLGQLVTRPAIATEGQPSAEGGLDGLGNAYSSAYIGTSLVWRGVPFVVPAPNGVSELLLTVPTPGAYSTLNLIAADTRGNRVSQSIDITYSDGTTVRTPQAFSDWSTPQGYPGESLALVMPARINASGNVLSKPTNLYGYAIPLDQTKQIQSIKLPGTPFVTVLGATLTP